jgi:hypothetical protein
MQVYTLPDGTTVHGADQFQIGDQKYPPGWLLTAPAADITAIGITVQTVADPSPPPVTVVSSLQFRQLFYHCRARGHHASRPDECTDSRVHG